VFGSAIKGLIGGLENGVKENADRARGDHVQYLLIGFEWIKGHITLAWIAEESIEESKTEEKGTGGCLQSYDYFAKTGDIVDYVDLLFFFTIIQLSQRCP
jgi:hypothetical protein